MNFDRIYEYRFQGVDLEKKRVIWKEIANFIYKRTGQPESVLDPAGGMCEFINAVPSKERYAVDINGPFLDQHAAPEVNKIIGDVREVELPENKFELVFISNFLEHLQSQDEVADLLEKLYKAIKPGGMIAIMGPNFKYTARNYFDFADHTVILSELGLAEHVYGAGFEIAKVHPRFLPLSFRGRLPVNRFLARTYLGMPFAWRFFGKQFLVFGRKPKS